MRDFSQCIHLITYVTVVQEAKDWWRVVRVEGLYSITGAGNGDPVGENLICPRFRPTSRPDLLLDFALDFVLAAALADTLAVLAAATAACRRRCRRRCRHVYLGGAEFPPRRCRRLHRHLYMGSAEFPLRRRQALLRPRLALSYALYYTVS